MASGSKAVRRSRSIRVTVGTFDGGVEKEPVPFPVRTTNVAAAAPDERPADVAVQEDGLLRTMGFRHVEDEQVGIAVPVQLFLDVDHDAQLVGLAQRRQELALHLVHVQHADDLHLLAALAHAEDQMPTLGVGECGDRLVGVPGHATPGFLELDVSPFVPTEQFDQLVLRHAVARCSALAGGLETRGSILPADNPAPCRQRLDQPDRTGESPDARARTRMTCTVQIAYRPAPACSPTLWQSASPGHSIVASRPPCPGRRPWRAPTRARRGRAPPRSP